MKLMTHPTGLAIVQARVGSPRDPLVMGKDTRSLSFKEENALAQSLAVVMTSQSQRKAKKQKQRSHGNESHKFLHINYKHCSLVMMLIGAMLNGLSAKISDKSTRREKKVSPF